MRLKHLSIQRVKRRIANCRVETHLASLLQNLKTAPVSLKKAPGVPSKEFLSHVERRIQGKPFAASHSKEEWTGLTISQQLARPLERKVKTAMCWGGDGFRICVGVRLLLKSPATELNRFWLRPITRKAESPQVSVRTPCLSGGTN